MKKKIGEYIITRKSDNEKITGNIWGTIYKSNDDKNWGGVYLTINPEAIDISMPLVKNLMNRADLKLSYNKKFYGEYYSLGSFGLLNKKDFDWVVNRLSYTNDIENDDYKYSIRMYHDFTYVIDANIVDKI